MAGLSVGAPATPHGSVATVIAFDRAPAARTQTARYLRLWLPTAMLATIAATGLVWLLA